MGGPVRIAPPEAAVHLKAIIPKTYVSTFEKPQDVE
jgi:hypothetical protein